MRFVATENDLCRWLARETKVTRREVGDGGAGAAPAWPFAFLPRPIFGMSVLAVFVRWLCVCCVGVGCSVTNDLEVEVPPTYAVACHVLVLVRTRRSETPKIYIWIY